MKAKWTWLVYMAGDNNLEGAGRADLKEMMKVGSTRDVHVLVEFDTEEKKAYRYRVEKGSLTTLETRPGINTGDPANLTAFIMWGAQTAPAERYALVVWNHGGGLEDGEFDYDAMRVMPSATVSRRLRANRALFGSTRDALMRKPPQQRAIAIDVGSRDYLDNQELRQALEKSGVHLDLLGCDACLMNMLEIAYEMRTSSHVMVGSEETEPGAGWPYTEILSRLTANPSMTPQALGQTIVRAYAAWYAANPSQLGGGAASQSALALSQIIPLCSAVQRLAAELVGGMGENFPAISSAAMAALRFEMADYMDLGDFTARLVRYLPSRSAAAAAASAVTSLVRSVPGFVIDRGYCGPHLANARGVSILFPSSPRADLDQLLADYDKLLFAKDYPAWRTMIAAYHREVRRPPE